MTMTWFPATRPINRNWAGSSNSALMKRTRKVHRVVVPILLVVFCSWFLTTRTVPPPVNDNNQRKQEPKPIWTWERYHPRWDFSHPSLLIGHYASQTEGDKYREMIKESVKASRAYCRRWKCDIVVLEGTLIKHPTNNKVGLVNAAIWRGYHRLLLMDADCVLVNHTVDLATDFLPRNKMVMSHHIYRNITREPWNANIGVTLWNLRHPWLLYFIRRWRKRCEADAGNNDQTQYHALMQGARNEWGNFQKYHLATTEAYFRESDGTVVKHFMRAHDRSWGQPAQPRIDSIREQVALVCQNNSFCDSFSL